MEPDDFKKLYEQEFSTAERTDLPWQLAKEYYERCDAYDATVCTGKGKEGPMPINGDEFRLINVNASKVLREVHAKAEAAGFTKSDVRDAMHEYSRKVR